MIKKILNFFGYYQIEDLKDRKCKHCGKTIDVFSLKGICVDCRLDEIVKDEK